MWLTVGEVVIMDREEFKKIVKGLKSIFSDPKFIADQDAFDMWYALLKDLDYEVASMATQAYMQTEKFSPTPADIRKYASQITSPLTNDMSEVEAWGMVSKAVCNSLYHSEEEFAKLPKLIQQTLGNHIRLRELAELEPSQLQTVEASNFMRSYKAKLESHKREMQLNDSLRLSISQMRQKNTPTLEVHEVEHKGIEIHESEEWVGIPNEIEDMLADFYKGVYKAI